MQSRDKDYTTLYLSLGCLRCLKQVKVVQGLWLLNVFNSGVFVLETLQEERRIVFVESRVDIVHSLSSCEREREREREGEREREREDNNKLLSLSSILLKCIFSPLDNTFTHTSPLSLPLPLPLTLPLTLPHLVSQA